MQNVHSYAKQISKPLTTILLPLVYLLFGLLLLVIAPNAGAASVTPTYVEGNPTCEDLGYTYGYKPYAGNVGGLENNPTGTFSFGGGTTTVTKLGTGDGISWTSTIGIDAVIVKGGPNANVYAYNPESTGDTNLVTPINPNNNTTYGLSHVVFCYDYNLNVSKTAVPSFAREWDWTIEKTGDQADLTLSTGQAFMVNYDVTVDATKTDSNWQISGVVTITNPDPNNAASVESIVDTLAGSPVVLNCNGSPTITTVAAGATVTCTYSVAMNNGDTATNTVTVVTSAASKVGGGTASATAIFTTPTTETDECITVTDSKYGALGQVCANEVPKTFSYALDVGSATQCGNYTYTNAASFVTNDSATTANSSWNVDVTMNCQIGCTLTQGYWKTHSSYGPAPYDNTWALLANGANTTFFISGKTYYQVLWTPPAGNAYYILAHQYIAAKLNMLNGASVPTGVQTAYNSASTLFNLYTPDSVAKNKTLKASFTALAGTLAQYNEGITGPGHCSE